MSAGANLALVIAMLFAPALMGLGRDVVALIGSGIAAAVVLRLGARRDFSPFVLILAGLIVSLWCGALAAILILMNDRYLAGPVHLGRRLAVAAELAAGAVACPQAPGRRRARRADAAAAGASGSGAT